MKRVVVKADTISDIEDERDSARTRYQEQKSKQESQRKQYYDKIDEIKQSIQSNVLDKISKVASPEFMSDVFVKVDRSYLNGFEVSVAYADNKPNDKNISLKWRWSANLTKEGKVEKSSNSWSGVQATTPQNLDNLKESLEVMQVLVGINDDEWYRILNTPAPEYEDYVTQEVDKFDESEYQDRIDEATLNKAIGTQTAFKLYDGQGQYYYKNAYVQIIRQTAKRYVVVEWSGTGLENDNGASSYNYSKPYQINKSRLIRYIEKPYKTIQVPEV